MVAMATETPPTQFFSVKHSAMLYRSYVPNFMSIEQKLKKLDKNEIIFDIRMVAMATETPPTHFLPLNTASCYIDPLCQISCQSGRNISS